MALALVFVLFPSCARLVEAPSLERQSSSAVQKRHAADHSSIFHCACKCACLKLYQVHCGKFKVFGMGGTRAGVEPFFVESSLWYESQCYSYRQQVFAPAISCTHVRCRLSVRRQLYEPGLPVGGVHHLRTRSVCSSFLSTAVLFFSSIFGTSLVYDTPTWVAGLLGAVWGCPEQMPMGRLDLVP